MSGDGIQIAAPIVVVDEDIGAAIDAIWGSIKVEASSGQDLEVPVLSATRDSADDLDDDLGGGTEVFMNPEGWASRHTHARISAPVDPRGSGPAEVEKLISVTIAGVDAEEDADTEVVDVDEIDVVSEMVPISDPEPAAPLTYVCLVEHVSSGDVFFLAAPTIGEFRRVVQERHASRGLSGDVSLTWLPMKIGWEVRR